MTLHHRIARTMCCPNGVCCSPGACYADDRSRSQLVDIHAATRAILAMLPGLLREEWGKETGPYSRHITLEAPQKAAEGG